MEYWHKTRHVADTQQYTENIKSHLFLEMRGHRQQISKKICPDAENIFLSGKHG
jgi:hypothetical protein